MRTLQSRTAQVLCALALATCFSSFAAKAVDLTVDVMNDPAPNGCTPGSCSLREAITHANATAGLDRIFLPATPEAITLTIPGAGEDMNATGDLDVRDEVEIIGAGSTATVIRQLAGDRVMNVRGPHLSRLRGFRLEGGVVDGVGGGLYTEISFTEISDVVFAGNRAQRGGGAAFYLLVGFYDGPETHLRGSRFEDNEAAFDGGGAVIIFQNSGNGAGALLQDVEFVDNVAGARGGGLRAEFPDGSVGRMGVVLERVDFFRNAAASGGAIHMQDAHDANDNGVALTLRESTVADNTASVAGGGLYVGYRAEVRQSTFHGNSVLANDPVNGGGGAIAVPAGFDVPDFSLIISRSTLSDNRALRGANLWVKGRRIGIAGSTITEPVPLPAGSTGSVLLFEGTTNRLELTNSLLAGSCAYPMAFVPSAAHGNVESPGNTCRLGTAAAASGNLTSQSAASLDLGPLADNGGRTLTRLPGAGSVAIDAGVLFACELGDQRGYSLVEAACDAGAVQANGAPPRLLRDGFEN